MNAPPTPAPVPPPPEPAKKSGNRTLLIVLGLLLGMMLLMGGCVVACTYYAAKKAQAYSAQVEKNPAYAVISVVAAIHPDVEVLAKDETSGMVTLRQKRTGKEVTIDTTQYTAETITAALEKFAAGAALESPADGTATRRLPRTAQSAVLPDYLPPYPRATAIDATDESQDGVRIARYQAQSEDTPAAIVQFYEQKLHAAGYATTRKSVAPGEATLMCLAGDPTRNVALTVTRVPDSSAVAIDLSFQQLDR